MGLKITAYRRLKEITNPQSIEPGDPEYWVEQWTPGAPMRISEAEWPGRGRPLKPNAVYEWEEEFDFYAGSYTAYKEWIGYLCQFKGISAFHELINFTSALGVIGSFISRKLCQDFKQSHVEAEIFARGLDTLDGQWFMNMYCQWETAFEWAACDGAVYFH